MWAQEGTVVWVVASIGDRVDGVRECAAVLVVGAEGVVVADSTPPSGKWIMENGKLEITLNPKL